MSPEPTARPEIDSSSVEGRNATIRWSVIGRSRDATGFLVQLFGPHGEKLWEETTLLNVLSTKLYNLEYRRDYQVVVQLVNCGSHGPPSRPHRIHIYKQGKINLGFETQNETLLMFKRIGGGYSRIPGRMWWIHYLLSFFQVPLLHVTFTQILCLSMQSGFAGSPLRTPMVVLSNTALNISR